MTFRRSPPTVPAPRSAERVLPNALPSGWSGTVFHVIMKTDSANSNPNETNENNNFGQMGQGLDRDSITITTPVQQPDLQGAVMSATDSRAVGPDDQYLGAGPQRGSGRGGGVSGAVVSVQGHHRRQQRRYPPCPSGRKHRV